MKKSFKITRCTHNNNNNNDNNNNDDDNNDDDNNNNIQSNVTTNQKEEVYLKSGRNLDRMLIPIQFFKNLTKAIFLYRKRLREDCKFAYNFKQFLVISKGKFVSD